MVAAMSLDAHADERQSAYRDDIARAQQAYEVRLHSCREFAGQPRISCRAEARAQLVNGIAIARARQDGTPEAAYRASLADSAAAFRAASEQCELLEGADRRGCIEEARDQRNRARGEAREALDAFTDRGSGARRVSASSVNPSDCAGGEAGLHCRAELRTTRGP
jgi:hypothetical protein